MPDSATAPLVITVESTGDSATVHVNGEIDIENCQQFADALAASASGHAHVHLDLGEVGYMDSSGLRALLVARTAAQDSDGTLDVTVASPIVARLFEITGLTDILTPAV